MEIVGAVVGIVNCLCPSNYLHSTLAEQHNYLKTSNMEKLRTDTQRLRARADDIETKLDLSVQQGNEPKAELNLWIENVQKVLNEAKSLIDEARGGKKCLNGYFPNYCSRLKLGRHIEEKIKEITELLKDDLLVDLQGARQNPSSSISTIVDKLPIPTVPLVGEATAKRNLKKIWEYLMDDNIRRIGVYGMGGVGKTTITIHIYNLLLKETSCFDSVIWITVSKGSNLMTLQFHIAKALKLEFSNPDNKISRAAELSNALNLKNRFVLILDDMWDSLALEDVGIPKPTRENGCKILLTTRLREVCGHMKTQKDVEVSVLSEEEAWELFKDNIDEDVFCSSEIEAIAKDVARECDGLPLGIVTVGRALAKVEDAMVWKNALNELKHSVTSIKGMEDKVFRSLRFSYKRLRDDMVRECFLYCAMYAEDHDIETKELIECWIGEGLIGDLGSTEEEICKGREILNELKFACMLENTNDVYGNECVKMHDLIRDMAIDIIRKSRRCIISAGMGLTKAPNKKEWKKDVKMVSLMKNDIQEITGKPKCPQLSSLFLQRNNLQNSSGSFFDHMYNLKVLNLSDTYITFLPDSFLNLKNLRVLLLSIRRLRKVPSLATLKELRTLDLSNTWIQNLPELGSLVNLRRLDLNHSSWKIFEVGVLSKLTLLEDLSIFKTSWKWGSERGSQVEELINATSFRHLQVFFKNSLAFDLYVRSAKWQVLRSFKFWVGRRNSDLDLRLVKNSVGISCCSIYVGARLIVLPDTILGLYISFCDDVTRLSLFSWNSTQLKECIIWACHKMECLVKAGENMPSLERLELLELKNIRELCKGIVPPDTFANLKFLDVAKCNYMTNLFPPGCGQHLQNLERIKIADCDALEDIISNEDIGEENNNNTITLTLPKLESLGLQCLPVLKRICSGVMVCDSLRNIQIGYCEKIERLPLYVESGQQISSSSEIEGSRKWWDSLKWNNHPNAQTLLQHFFKEAYIKEEEIVVVESWYVFISFPL